MNATAAPEGPGPLWLVGRYDRDLKASVARVWENVFDWEHLPSLHSSTFATVELIDRRPAGNRLRLVGQPGDPARAQVIELEADIDAGRYTVTTREGPGAGTQIITRLTPIAPQVTKVEVEFHVPEARPERLKALGRRYAETYARLWDEDEEMMRVRQAALDRRPGHRSAEPPPPLHLGDAESLLSRLPLVVDFNGGRFRVAEVAGEIVVHAAQCPHWLGPLDAAPIVDNCLRCPWHGYLFDVRDGRSADGRGLRLATPPEAHIGPAGVTLRRRPA